MKSNEYWMGYHASRQDGDRAINPFKYEPVAGRDWKRGYAAQQAERNRA